MVRSCVVRPAAAQRLGAREVPSISQLGSHSDKRPFAGWTAARLSRAWVLMTRLLARAEFFSSAQSWCRYERGACSQ